MKGVRNSLVLFAASVVIAGAEPVAPVVDESATFSQQLLTYSSVRAPLELNAEPQVSLGSNLQLDGLFVFCVKPQETWNMLDPSVPVLNPQKQVPPSLLPVTAPQPLNNAAVHEANFVLLRLSFP